MFRNLKVSTRLALGFGVVSLLLAAVVLLGIRSLANVKDNVDDGRRQISEGRPRLRPDRRPARHRDRDAQRRGVEQRRHHPPRTGADRGSRKEVVATAWTS
jgi:hypothetical protein